MWTKKEFLKQTFDIEIEKQSKYTIKKRISSIWNARGNINFLVWPTKLNWNNSRQHFRLKTNKSSRDTKLCIKLQKSSIEKRIIFDEKVRRNTKKKKSSELYENLNFQFVPTIKTRKIQIKKIE